ncbi:uncharacterized protein PHALS_15477 [Plasmopara halstedii]|uniref:Uncharacterized protein n=1 Tax=Plasmopara halstedii TaxID=4781 RepID=A0A0P1AIF9_PLAHL|nr:uncharacterized protein PHALS_15477 [Plasmopara halstedii]CEG40926.1 hypothetical protein PHALS_15477 [Plasmopara halstedii]|eukprot:XP_024577295.1 hypothetical protein PHALS_15477 [Plasmopara halstedii]
MLIAGNIVNSCRSEVVEAGNFVDVPISHRLHSQRIQHIFHRRCSNLDSFNWSYLKCFSTKSPRSPP